MDLTKAQDFIEFINSDLDYKERQIKLYEEVNLSIDTKNIIKNSKKEIKIIVFAEIYCPDCRIVMPFLEKINRSNDKIRLFIFPREGYEDLMKEYTAKVRIPTIITLDQDNNLIGSYIEFPKQISTEIENNLERREEIISNYRSGEYNQIIEEEIMKTIILVD